MYYKIPVLMSDCEVLKNISDYGKRCKLFKKGDITSLINSIDNIIKKGYSQKLIMEAYNFVKNERNWNYQIKSYLKLLNSN